MFCFASCSQFIDEIATIIPTFSGTASDLILEEISNVPTTADAVYSKVDFSDDGISQRRMKVKSRSFFDIVRKEIVKDNLIFVGELRGDVGNRSFEISSLKYYWLILDKLVQDPVVEGSDAFIEFAQLVVDLSSSSSISSSSSSTWCQTRTDATPAGDRTMPVTA